MADTAAQLDENVKDMQLLLATVFIGFALATT